jgi:hypothetical protein
MFNPSLDGQDIVARVDSDALTQQLRRRVTFSNSKGTLTTEYLQ